MVDLLIGVGVGVTSSLAAWWLVNCALTPLIEISPKISKVRRAGVSGWSGRYRVKYRNRRRRWWPWRSAAVDVRISAHLRVFGTTSRTWTSWKIPVSGSAAAWVQTNRVVVLEISKIEFDGGSAINDELQAIAARSPGRLEPLLAVRERSEVRVVISAAHVYTGARRTFVARYTLNEIEEGKFDRRGVGLVPGVLQADEQPTPSRDDELGHGPAV